MKIDELKKVIDKAYKKGKGCYVEFYITLTDGNSIWMDVKDIGQFNIIPDTTITFEIKDDDLDLYSKILNTEEIKYKKEYLKLKKKLEKIKDMLGE